MASIAHAHNTAISSTPRRLLADTVEANVPRSMWTPRVIADVAIVTIVAASVGFTALVLSWVGFDAVLAGVTNVRTAQLLATAGALFTLVALVHGRTSKVAAGLAWVPLALAASLSAIVACLLLDWRLLAAEGLPGVAFAATLAVPSAMLALAFSFALRSALRTNVAIYGATETALALRVDVLRSDAYNFAGLYDERRGGQAARTAPIHIDGNILDLVEQTRLGKIDQIILALPQGATERMAEIAARLQQYPVKVLAPMETAAQVIDADAAPSQVVDLVPVGNQYLVACRAEPMGDWGFIAKSVFDRLAAAVLLIGLSPIFALIGVAIKLDSKGPVFFRQKRHGLAGETIMVWKFRSMRVMEDGAVIRQAVKGDRRVTRVGGFLRRTSLDELPQLINVVLGSMSLVGPRPHALAHNEHFARVIATYDSRNRVRPGITGWAQINGFRGETQTTEEMSGRVEHDIWYVSNWSFFLDLKILLLTPVYGFIHKNAY